MTIIVDRGLLVQSGKFAQTDAEVLVDALDAATHGPATKADLNELRAELSGNKADGKADTVLLSQRIDQAVLRLEGKIESTVDKIVVRLGGLMIALVGPAFAASRFLKT